MRGQFLRCSKEHFYRFQTVKDDRKFKNLVWYKCKQSHILWPVKLNIIHSVSNSHGRMKMLNVCAKGSKHEQTRLLRVV